MSKIKEASGKDFKLSRILQVQEVIDFYVLAEIRGGVSYLLELDERMVKDFDGVGVNLSYMSRRINFLRENGYVETYWDDPIKRNIHYVRITEQGEQYFLRMLADLSHKIGIASKFYRDMEKYVAKFGHLNLTK